MSNFDLKDSGERRTFASGAVRDRGELKPRPDLVSPHAEDREGMVLARGAEKYKARNWEKGLPISECVASLSRHLKAYKLGLRDEDHMAQLRTNAGFILHYEEEIKAGRMDPAIDDMPKYAMPVICPRCDASMASQWTAETGVEYFCDECGFTSLDSFEPRSEYRDPTIGVDTGEESEGVPVRGFMYPNLGDESEAVNALSFITQMDDKRGGNEEMIRGVPSRTLTVAEIEIRNSKTLRSDDDVHCPYCGTLFPQIKTWDMFECPQCGWNPVDAVPYPPSDTKYTSPISKPPTFYVAGPMRGYSNLNFPAFDEAAQFGRSRGYTIISPADLDRQHGIDPQTDPSIVEHESTGMTFEELQTIIRRDIEVIMALRPDRKDGIAVLEGWEHSTGATAEVALARWLGLRIVQADDFCTLVEVE